MLKNFLILCKKIFCITENIKLKNKTALQGNSHVFYLIKAIGEENSVRTSS